jgi:carnitine-CoA ligase
LQFLIPRMPHYMVPRYVRVMESLPKTPTNKVRKVEIRQQGVTADCWDRVAAGIAVRRTKL